MTNAELPTDPFADDIEAQVAQFAAFLDTGSGASAEQLEALAETLYLVNTDTEVLWEDVDEITVHVYRRLAATVEHAGWAPVSL